MVLVIVVSGHVRIGRETGIARKVRMTFLTPTGPETRSTRLYVALSDLIQNVTEKIELGNYSIPYLIEAVS